MTHCRSHCWAIYGIYHISSFKPAFLSVVDFVVFMLMETYVDVIFDVYADGAYVVVVSVGLCICLLSIPQVNVDVPAQAICAVWTSVSASQINIEQISVNMFPQLFFWEHQAKNQRSSECQYTIYDVSTKPNSCQVDKMISVQLNAAHTTDQTCTVPHQATQFNFSVVSSYSKLICDIDMLEGCSFREFIDCAISD